MKTRPGFELANLLRMIAAVAIIFWMGWACGYAMAVHSGITTSAIPAGTIIGRYGNSRHYRSAQASVSKSAIEQANFK